MNEMKITDLLSSLCEGLPEEEKTLIGLQAMISSEISIKRQELGLSQKQFAEKMNVTQALISKWESGDANFTLKTLVQIAHFLGIKMQSPYILPPPAAKYTGKCDKIVYISDYTTAMSKPFEYSYTSEDSIPDEM